VPEAEGLNGRLEDVLSRWAAGDEARGPVAATTLAIAGAALSLGRLLETGESIGGELPSELSGTLGVPAVPDVEKMVNAEAHALFVESLRGAPVAAVLSEESDHVVGLQHDAPLVVALDPLDGSGNLSVNGPAGAIYSIRPSSCGGSEEDFLRPGREQVGAGFVLFGPATVLVASVGAGTDVYVLRRDDDTFVRQLRGLHVPLGTPAYSVNAANARHWTPEVRTYVADLQAGSEGLRGKDFDMRWHGALVIEAFRILRSGGIYLYPEDDRPAYRSGRLRLVYEAHPIAYLMEQAGGRATDGETRILDKAAPQLHARTPLVFGSTDKVERLERYLKSLHADAERHPLFTTRGLLR
jgi:fructose-1,6-bisphosphatase I